MPTGRLGTISRYNNLAGTGSISTTSYTDAIDRITNLQHQAAGGTNISNYTYTYDNLNHLTEADYYSNTNVLQKSVVFKYDAFGNRIEEDVTTTSTVTTRFALDGWNPAKGDAIGTENFDVWADMDGSNHVTMRYIRGDAVDQIFAREDSGGTVAWYLLDRLGSVRDMTDSNGTQKDHIDYDGWGNVINETSPTFSDRYKWTGREYDAATGLQYNRARFYDPAAGRWISQDPLGFDAGDSNLYRYLNNSPTLFHDPSGLCRPSGDESDDASDDEDTSDDSDADYAEFEVKIAYYLDRIDTNRKDFQKKQSTIMNTLRRWAHRGFQPTNNGVGTLRDDHDAQSSDLAVMSTCWDSLLKVYRDYATTVDDDDRDELTNELLRHASRIKDGFASVKDDFRVQQAFVKSVEIWSRNHQMELFREDLEDWIQIADAYVKDINSVIAHPALDPDQEKEGR